MLSSTFYIRASSLMPSLVFWLVIGVESHVQLVTYSTSSTFQWLNSISYAFHGWSCRRTRRVGRWAELRHVCKCIKILRVQPTHGGGGSLRPTYRWVCKIRLSKNSTFFFLLLFLYTTPYISCKVQHYLLYCTLVVRMRRKERAARWNSWMRRLGSLASASL
jgi:hypothetical protein